MEEEILRIIHEWDASIREFQVGDQLYLPFDKVKNYLIEWDKSKGSG